MGERTWTAARLRHAAAVLRRGRNPAAAVYDSIGVDFFLALDRGWLNLGLWEGDGSDRDEAPTAVRRLVRRLAEPLPAGGIVLDVGNGLGEQDPLIAEVARPERLVALNVTLSQLAAGRDALARAAAHPVNGDATRPPLRDASVDGVISVEAAFHFPSRVRFFRESYRVLRPGGILTMSDISTQRRPRTPLELLDGLAQLRIWGLRISAAKTAAEIAAMCRRAGFVDVRAELVGDRVIPPALRWVRDRLERGDADAPRAMQLAARVALGQVERLWRGGLIEYLLLEARKPA